MESRLKTKIDDFLCSLESWSVDSAPINVLINEEGKPMIVNLATCILGAEEVFDHGLNLKAEKWGARYYLDDKFRQKTSRFANIHAVPSCPTRWLLISLWNMGSWRGPWGIRWWCWSRCYIHCWWWSRLEWRTWQIRQIQWMQQLALPISPIGEFHVSVRWNRKHAGSIPTETNTVFSSPPTAVSQEMCVQIQSPPEQCIHGRDAIHKLISEFMSMDQSKGPSIIGEGSLVSYPADNRQKWSKRIPTGGCSPSQS